MWQKLDGGCAVVFSVEWFDGPYMANKSRNHEKLTNDQLHELAIIILDVYGSGLPKCELEESIALVLEDVPGFELASTQTIQRVISQVRRYYDDEIHRRNQEN